MHDPDGVRLQKLLAAAGVGSRRVCEDLISQGRVQVDGQVVTELGVRIRATQTVHVDGVRVQLDESRVYLAFNKPIGVVTSMSDELGRVDIGDFVANRKERLFHVGRLDADTEGLLILTNDGDLAHRLQHPRYGVLKTYLAQIPGPVPRDLGRRLREGIELEDGPVQVDSFRVVDSAPGKALVEVVLHEGRKHIVRRMLAEVGHPVITLVRMQVGPDPPRRHQARQVAQPDQRGGRGPLRRGRAVTRVHVVGTGLVGTSLGLALRRLGDDVTLEDISPTHAALARDLGRRAAARRPGRARPRRRRHPAGRHRGLRGRRPAPLARRPPSPTSRRSRAPCSTRCAPTAPTSPATAARTRWPVASAPARCRAGTTCSTAGPGCSPRPTRPTRRSSRWSRPSRARPAPR